MRTLARLTTRSVVLALLLMLVAHLWMLAGSSAAPPGMGSPPAIAHPAGSTAAGHGDHSASHSMAATCLVVLAVVGGVALLRSRCRLRRSGPGKAPGTARHVSPPAATQAPASPRWTSARVHAGVVLRI